MSKPPLKPPERRGPALGALDGIRRDLKAAKEGGDSYDPRGVGTAWSHNFLNQKPWHPLNFRNQARVWEAEQAHYENEKRKEEARAEFESEQDYLKTISLLSEEEQKKYKERQSVSWLYMKPPGYDDALQRAEKEKKHEEGGERAKPPGSDHPLQQHQHEQQAGREGRRGVQQSSGHLAKMLQGLKAAQQMDKFEMRPGVGGDRSPPRGGFDLGRENQQFVLGDMDSSEEEEAMRMALMPEEERRRLKREAARRAKQAKKDAERQQLEQAKAFLRAAGLALPSDGEQSSGSGASSENSDATSSDSGRDSGGESSSSADRTIHKRRSEKNRKEEKGQIKEGAYGGNKHRQKVSKQGKHKQKAKGKEKQKHKKKRHHKD